MGKPTEEFKALAERYGMRGHHFHADRRGFIIVTRAGIDYLQAKLDITVDFLPVYAWSDASEGRYVIQADGFMDKRRVTSYGEVSAKNNTNPYPVAMAEKRALSRVVLKLVGMYELGAMGEDEL